jgi:hypothetical protein
MPPVLAANSRSHGVQRRRMSDHGRNHAVTAGPRPYADGSVGVIEDTSPETLDDGQQESVR